MEIQITDVIINKLPKCAYWWNGELAYTSIEHIYHINGLALENIELIPEELINEISTLYVPPTYYKIYDLLYDVPEQTIKEKFPGHIIFPEQLSMNLHKIHTKYYGTIISTHYYKNYDAINKIPLEPIVKIEYEYFRGNNYLLDYKIKTVSWMLSDDTWSKEQQIDTIYCVTESERLIEVRELRVSIIDEAEALAKQFGLWPYVKPLFEKYMRSIDLYKEAGSKQFSEFIKLDVEHSSWLDQMTHDGKMTIRKFLSDFFLIGCQD